MQKIVYLDVDGTLLDDTGKISALNQKVIIEIQKKGIWVALASGRNYKEIKEIAQQLEIDKNLNYSICQNGAYVTTIDQFKPSSLNLIAAKKARALFEFLTKKELLVLISSYKNQDLAFTNLDLQTKEFKQKILPLAKLTKINNNLDWNSISMIAFECEKQDVQFLEDYLQTHFSELEYVCSQSVHRIKPLFMVNAKDTSKANSILELNEKLKISADQTYFFGDGINDVCAIKKFNHSFVPLNAPDYVKVIAKNIICPSHEDGVGIKLKELFLEN